MSDNEIEDVSFLPGENLHRKAVYEPNILQKIRLIACTKGRLTVFAVIAALVFVIIVLIGALSHNSHDTSEGTIDTGSHTESSTSEGTIDTGSSTPTIDYISTNGKPFPYKNIRLPDAVIPVHYNILMHPNISKSVFTGTVDISCQVLRDTSFIIFHIKDLNLTKLTLKDTENGNRHYVIEEYLEFKTNEQVYVKLGSSLTSGSKVTLVVSFEAQLISKLAGFYKSMYKTKTGEKRYIATTHFEPTDARAAFPCFDEPQLKATFELTMIRDKNHLSLFNMPLDQSTELSNGLVQDKFEKSVKMSTYLVAFVVCDYKNKTKQTKRNVTVGVYAPEESIESATFALDAAVKIIDYYETFFGVKYPLPKQDLIAIPDFAAGAMENWGLITYRMTAILYDEKVSSAKNQQWVAVVVAHELAHQWFGNLVTMAWWDDLWLNEGFASFVEYLGSNEVQKEWKMPEQFVDDALLNALYLDCLSNSHPINQAVSNPNQINELFDTITYDKGASIIRMLSNYLGDDVFKTGLTAYLNKYKFGNAATNDLWNSLSGAVTQSSSNLGTDVHRLMETWTEQMGYPVITLTKTGTKVTMTQSRFLLNPKAKDTGEFTSPFGYKWQVPFSYSTSSNSTKVNKILLKETMGSFQVASDINWVKGNCGMYGYYRVNYDTESWKSLIQQLSLNHLVFTTAERAGIIDDAFMLARAGHIKQSVPLLLSQYLVNEEDYLPWTTLLANMKYLETRLENKPVYHHYKIYLLKLMKKQLNKINWKDEGTHLQKYLKAAILAQALHFDDKKAVDDGKKLFEDWKNGKSINVNLKSVIYHTGITHGTEDDWEFVWNAYLNESDASEKKKLLGALGHSRDTRLLSRLLNYGLVETVVRSQDTGSVIAAVSSTPAGQLLSWRFVEQHWKIFYDRYSTTSFILPSILKSVASSFDTEFDYNEVSNFFKSRDAGAANRAVKQVLEKIQMNSDWLSAYEKEVTDWFMSH